MLWCFNAQGLVDVDGGSVEGGLIYVYHHEAYITLFFSAPFRFVEAVAHTASFSHLELSSLPTVELWPLCMLGVTRCVLFGLVFSCNEKQATMISTSFLC